MDWKYSFQLDDGKVLITDRCILIDHRYVMPAEMPPAGKAGKHRRAEKYLGLPSLNRFRFDTMATTNDHHAEGPDGLVLNRKYVSFLLERIPPDLLHFGMTGDRKAPVWIYREEEPVGLLMPLLMPPPFDGKLVADAIGGDAEAQYYLGCYYQKEDGPLEKDYVLARKWFEEAAGQNHPKANLSLGLMYVVGNGCGHDHELAMKYLDAALGLGCKEAARWRHMLMEYLPPIRAELIDGQEKGFKDPEENDGSE